MDEANTNHPFIMNEPQLKPFLKPLRKAVLIGVGLHLGSAFAQTSGASVRAKAGVAQTQQAPALAATDTADRLASGAEIFENLTEGAAAMDAATYKKALSEFEKLYPEIYPRLPPDRKIRLDTLVTGVRNAWQKGNRGAMAIQSIEAYRLLQESIDHGGQLVPIEVSLLDYAGFKLNGLLLSTRRDWKEVARTAQEASKWWSAIGPGIADKTLREAMDHRIEGINDGAARNDPELLRFAAAMDLILVDGLEAFFGSHPPTP